jgi:hypothetical protein
MQKIQLIDVLLNSKIFGIKRSPKSRNDFGDDETVGMHVRKIGEFDQKDLDPDAHVWGRYLGGYNGKWYVGTYPTSEFCPKALTEYDSLEKLKQVWELD